MQFRVSLRDVRPEIWRAIEVPDSYSFWDLHVAIQDAMGWLDYHLHLFHVRRGRSRATTAIGIPDELRDDIIPGWEAKLTDWFTEVGATAEYLYDFGDGWEHDIQLTGIVLASPGRKRPRCTGGAMACPPEDCGGPYAYEDLVGQLDDPSTEEHKGLLAWVKDHPGNHWPFEPARFDPDQVVFDDPALRFKRAFGER